MKGLEDRLSDGVVGVKVSPRTYETPTVPDGQFAVDLTLTIRSDVDADGQLYLEATQAVSQMIHNWQKCQARVEADFSLGGEFVPTGFQITDGDCGLDRENVIWQYSQSFALYGIIT